MQKNRLITASVVFAITATSTAALLGITRSGGANDVRATRQHHLREEQAKEIWTGDILSEDPLSYDGYVVEKRYRKVRDESPGKMRSRPSWIDVSYAVIKHKGSVRAKFDANIYFGMGNNTRFGLFSFLNGPTSQIIVSQDVFRGGTQWVISLAPEPRIIFDGPDWAVGREGDDMRIVDLDNDSVFEITVPITDFYDFQDKLPIARIPLPQIIFKYDGKAMKYVPANPLFESYALQRVSDRKVEKDADEFDKRAMAIENLLALIYVGKQREAWELYNRSYALDDKEKIRRRVKTILNRQPVYKFIYNPRRYK